MKTEYTIEKGTHYSKGKKSQPSLLALIPAAVGIALHLMHDVSIWYSILCYAVSAVLYVLARRASMFTVVKAVFDQTCIYEIAGPDQYDINKLFGLYFGGQDHSARFGWNSNGGRIDIYAYMHKNGKIESKKLLDCAPNEPVELSLKVTPTDYEFTATKRDGERARMKSQRTKSWYSFLVYRGYPYFGGNQTAPHDMRMEVTYME